MRRLTSVAAAVTAVAVVSCSTAERAGVFGAPVEPPATEPPATVDTTAGDTPDGTVQATRVEIDIRETQNASRAWKLIPAANGRGHLLLGSSRREGEPARPAMWDSPDGLRWDAAPVPTAPEGQQYVVADIAWVGAQLVAGGSVNDGTGDTAAVWFASDGRNFPTAFEQPVGAERSSLTALAATDAGPLVVGQFDDDDALFVATRDAAGSWQRATVPDVSDFDASGVAASGPTVVITGTDSSVRPVQARALVSLDGGRTFSLADTSIFAGGVDTSLGGVAAVTGGFVASACAPTPAGHVTALARSTDGVTWTRQDLRLVGDDAGGIDLRSGGCGPVVVDGDRVLLGLVDVGAWTLDVSADGTATPTYVDGREGEVDTDTPLVVVTGEGVVAIGRTTGGFTPVLVTTGQFGTGLPRGRPLLRAVGLDALSDTLMVRAVLYPLVTDDVIRTFRRWFEYADGSARPSLTSDDVFDVHPSPFGDLALGTVADPADVPTTGPINGTAWYVRGADRIWQAQGLLASGPGGEQVWFGASSATLTVAVGNSSVRDATTNATTSQPLVFVTGDGRAWSHETIATDPAADAWLNAACASGDRFVAFGGTVVNGVRQTLVAVRDVTGVWGLAPPGGLPLEQVLGGCAVLDETLVVYGSGVDRPAVYTTTDLVTFTPGDVSGSEFRHTSFTDVEVVGERFVAVGSAETAGDAADGAVWTSADGRAWSRLDVEGVGGLGDQNLTSVAVAPDGSVVLAGLDNGAAVLWTLPADTL